MVKKILGKRKAMASVYAVALIALSVLFYAGYQTSMTSRITGAGGPDNPFADSYNVQQGLMAYYRMNGNAMDFSGNNRNGEIHDANFAASEGMGGAYRYDGENDYINIGDHLGEEKYYTVSLFFKTSSLQTMTLLQMGKSGACFYNPSIVLSEGRLFVSESGCNSVGRIGGKAFNGIPFALGKWNHVAVTRDNNVVKVYVNGRLELTDEKQPSPPMGTPGKAIIGASWHGKSLKYVNSFIGFIDEVGVWNRPLSENEVVGLYGLGGALGVSVALPIPYTPIDYMLVETFPTDMRKFYSTKNTPYTKWTVERGGWVVENGILKNLYGAGTGLSDVITLNSPISSPGKSIKARLKSNENRRYPALDIGFQDVNNTYKLSLNAVGEELQLWSIVDGQKELVTQGVQVNVGEWYDMELRWMTPTKIEGEIWNTAGRSLGRVEKTVPGKWTQGKFGLEGVRGVKGSWFDDIKIGGFATGDIVLPPEKCPDVCVPLWVFENGACTFHPCENGCSSADGVTAFDTESECKLKTSIICPLGLPSCQSGFTLIKENVDGGCPSYKCVPIVPTPLPPIFIDPGKDPIQKAILFGQAVHIGDNVVFFQPDTDSTVLVFVNNDPPVKLGIGESLIVGVGDQYKVVLDTIIPDTGVIITVSKIEKLGLLPSPTPTPPVTPEDFAKVLGLTNSQTATLKTATVILSMLGYLDLKLPVQFIEPPISCPDTCVEMWELKSGGCVLNTCGSGCGPDNLNTIKTEQECKNKLPSPTPITGGGSVGLMSPISTPIPIQASSPTPEITPPPSPIKTPTPTATPFPPGTIVKVAGSGQCFDPKSACGDGGLGISAYLNNPSAVGVDSVGNIYISDVFDYKIRKVNKDTGKMETIAGTGEFRYVGDGRTQSEPLNGPVNGLIVHPGAMDVDGSGNIFFSDNRPDGRNPRIRKLTPDGNGGYTISTIAELSAVDIITDISGNIYIASSLRIMKLIPNGNGGYTISAVAGTGNLGSSADGIPAIEADLNRPSGIALDSSGNIYVTEDLNNKVRKLTLQSDGSYIISTIAGTGEACNRPNACGDGGPAKQAKLWGPSGIAVDKSGNIYFSDSSNMRVRKLMPDAGSNPVTYTISTVIGKGSKGCSGDNGLSTSALVWLPQGLELDSKSGLYMADSACHTVRKVIEVDKK